MTDEMTDEMTEETPLEIRQTAVQLLARQLLECIDARDRSRTRLDEAKQAMTNARNEEKELRKQLTDELQQSGTRSVTVTRYGKLGVFNLRTDRNGEANVHLHVWELPEETS